MPRGKTSSLQDDEQGCATLRNSPSHPHMRRRPQVLFTRSLRFPQKKSFFLPNQIQTRAPRIEVFRSSIAQIGRAKHIKPGRFSHLEAEYCASAVVEGWVPGPPWQKDMQSGSLGRYDRRDRLMSEGCIPSSGAPASTPNVLPGDGCWSKAVGKCSVIFEAQCIKLMTEAQSPQRRY